MPVRRVTLCRSSSATGFSRVGVGVYVLTNPHNNHETGEKPSQFHYTTASRIHEVFMAGRFAAEPIGSGGQDICGDDKKGEVVSEQGGGEDDEEEADGQDLFTLSK